MSSEGGRAGVICAGAMCVDYIREIDRWPPQEGLAEIVAEERQGGASTFNMAVDLRRLGATWPVGVMGLLGEDSDAEFILETLDAAGVDTARVNRTRDFPTSYTQVMTSRETGRRTFFYRPGTNHGMGPEHFDFEGCDARLLHAGMPGIHNRLDPEGPDGMSGWADVLRRARRAGMMTNVELVSIAPQAIAAVTRPLLPHLDLLVVNDVEVGGITGIATVSEGRTDVAAVRRAVLDVMERGAMSLAAVHFPAGCIAIQRGGEMVSRASVRVPPEDMRGSNGAGDAFAAGLIYALLEGWPLDDMLSLAHASAAASLRSLSTVGSVIPAREALALAARWGWRDDLSW